MKVQQGESRALFVGALVLTVLTFAAYLPSMQGQFIWDDDRHVFENRALRSAEGLRDIWLVRTTEPQYYPLTHTTFWIEHAIWGLNTTGYHLVNVLLHVLNALLLWRLLSLLELRGAWVASMLFALHPVQVESVAWISERKNVLSMFFYLLALIAYLSPKPAFHGRVLLSFLFFVCALLSKTVACSMPAVALLLLWWKRGRLERRDLLTIPFFIAGFIAAYLTGVQERDHVGAVGADWDLSVPQRLLIAGRAVWFYVGKIIWPADLMFSYPRWQVDARALWQWLFPISLAVALVVLFVLRGRIGRGPAVAALIFCGVLVPALGFVNTYPMRYSFVADHFQYMAAAALFALIATGIARARALHAALVVLLFALTFNHARAFAGPEAIWMDTIAKNPHSWMARHNLALLYTRRPDDTKLIDAVKLYEHVAAIRPNHDKLHFNWSDALMRLGRWEDAIEHCREGLKRMRPSRDPERDQRTVARVYMRMGQALLQLNRPDDAAGEFRRAVELDHALVDAHLGLADAMFEQKRVEEALSIYSAVARTTPDDPRAHLTIARVCDQLGRDGRAVEAYRTYLKLVAHDAQAHASLGVLLGRQGRFQEAADAFSAALKIDPTLEPAKRGLTLALASQRKRPATTTHAE